MRIKVNKDIQLNIRGWERRHLGYPNIHAQFQCALRGDYFQIMYRGCKILHSKSDIFQVGQKADAALHGGNLSRLKYTFRDLSEDPNKFGQIAKSFIASPMHRRSKPLLSVKQLMEQYDKFDANSRFLLCQLLIFGLQYQNCKPGIREWKDYLFVISCTCSGSIALKYALSPDYSGSLPERAYVLEYGCPLRCHYFTSVANVIEHFSELNLGYIFPDNDREFFVFNAILPHYLLGYTELTKAEDCDNVYRSLYIANPYYDKEGATLDNPPDLTEHQKELIDQTTEKMAWVFHNGTEWDKMRVLRKYKTLLPPRDKSEN